MSFSSDSSASSPPALDWKFSQVFGDRLPGEDVRDIDAISAIEFDRNGDHLAVGDRGGRLVIFQDNGGGKDDLVKFTPRNELERLDRVISKHPTFQYKTEFQSHEPEFDYLKSVEIEEKINKVRWCAASTGSLNILSSNDKTIKLWKVSYSSSFHPNKFVTWSYRAFCKLLEEGCQKNCTWTEKDDRLS